MSGLLEVKREVEDVPCTDIISTVTGALFDFTGFLTTRDERTVLSARDDASPAVDALIDFLAARGISSDDYIPDVVCWANEFSVRDGQSFEPLTSQVDRLATFIMDEVDGEPSQNEGAIDCAIRIIRSRLEK